MKQSALWTVFLLIVLVGCSMDRPYSPQNGDIVFQTSKSSQSLAIQRATRSPYSHMGIIYVNNGKAVVFEAIQPVKSTPLPAWIDRGKDRHFVVKRLKAAGSLLTKEAVAKMMDVGSSFQEKSYDLTFEWSDERMYCSELVWKIYKRAMNIEIGALQTLAEFDLSDPGVREIMAKRWKGSPPWNEPVISPVAMFESPLLFTVYEQ